MANIKITELNAAGSLAANDVLPVVDISTDETKKITSTNLFRTLPDGTAAAPALAFSSDQANGIYLAGTDTVGITTGGTQRVTVDASGNVVISGDLTVQGATTTVESTTVTIDDKNIELGSVASPSNTTADGGGITLKGASDKTIKWINSTGCWTFNQPTNFNDHVQIDSSGRLLVGTTTAGAYSNRRLTVATSSGTTALELRSATNGDSRIVFTDSTSSSDTGAYKGQILYDQSSDYMSFNTNGNNERLRIDSSGNVFIGGTTAASADIALNANGSAEFAGQVQVGDYQSAVTNKNGFQLRTTGEFVQNCSTTDAYTLYNNNSTKSIVLRSNGSASFSGNVTVQDGVSGVSTSASDALTIETSDVTSKTRGIGIYGKSSIPSTYEAFQLYYNGSQNVTIKYDGSASFAGNVGIGTASPSGRLTIKDGGYRQGIVLERAASTTDRGFIYIGDGTNSTVADEIYLDANNTAFHFRQGGSGTTETVTFKADGKVGIGTTSPANNLDIAVDSNNEGIRISSSTNVFGKIDFHANRSGADAALGILDFNWNGTQVARIIGGTGTDTTNKDDGALQFHTAAAGSAGEAMRIDSSGNVGIGTSSPANKLHVSDTSGSAQIRITGSSGSSNIYADSNIYFQPNGSTAVTLASSGNVGIGTTSPSTPLHIKGAADSYLILQTGTTDGNDGILFHNSAGAQKGVILFDTDNDYMLFSTNNTERMRIDSSGRLLLGTTTEGIADGDNLTIADSGPCGITLRSGSSSGGAIYFSDATSGAGEYAGFVEYLHSSDALRFASGGTERMRIDSSGNVTLGRAGTSLHFQNGFNNSTSRIQNGGGSNSSNFKFLVTNSGSESEAMRIDSSGHILFGTTTNGSTAVGTVIRSTGETLMTRDDGNSLLINRMSTDGILIDFRQNNTSEGSINVSGSSVTLVGAHLSRWSQLPGGVERIEILRGSVLSNLDEMCEWGEEDNEQLNRMKVSDVEGDKNVSGVFQSWDDDDNTYVNDFHCAMTGDFVIRIAQGTTVARGDLLMSAGDGTAKPQDDDIVRSKTIAKVTSTTVSTTYSDNSYCVPCVLMAC